MGNASSSGGAGSGSGTGGRQGPAAKRSQQKEDHYSVLGISSESTSDEIKKAYRKAALIHHPDKNPNDVAAATLKFSIIQSAYEVLSDEQERAWYDDHRDEIDQGDAGGYSNEEEAAYFEAMRNGAKGSKPRSGSRGITTPQLMKFFTTECFAGFDDSPSGFYTTYRVLFTLLAIEEPAYAYPSFGTSTSVFASTPPKESDIKSFYAAFMNFSTDKEFAWKDSYRVEEGMDRRMKRQVEKENLKDRALARREYNDTVRSLVMYIRRRDPRYLISLSTLSVEAFRAAKEAKLKADLLLAAKERAAEAAVLAAAYVTPSWDTSGTKSSTWDDGILERDGESDEEEEEENWCVPCGKGFRSGGSWEAHERSRKHGKNLERMVKEMVEQDQALGLDGTAGVVEDQELSEEESEGEGEGPAAKMVEALARGLAGFDLDTPPSTVPPSLSARSDASTSSEPEEEESQTRKSKLSKKQKKSQRAFVSPLIEGEEAMYEEEEVEAVGMVSKKTRGKKGKKAPPPPLEAKDDLIEQEGELDAVLEELPESSGGKKSRRAKKTSTSIVGTPEGSGRSTPIPLASTEGKEEDKELKEAQDDFEGDDGRELSKKDKRRAKDAAKQAGGVIDELRCNVCSTMYGSRSKLFAHIKETGHAQAELKEELGKGAKGKKGKR